MGTGRRGRQEEKAEGRETETWGGRMGDEGSSGRDLEKASSG